jgi:hypothetical protein
MQPTMTTIYDEVLAVAKAQGVRDKSASISDQDFLKQISEAISTCPDNAWYNLSEPAKTWFNQEAREAINSLKPIPFPQGYKDVPGEISTPAPTPVVGAVVSKVYEAQTGRTQSAVPNIANTPQAKKKPEGVIGAIRKTIILNPDWTTRLVHDYLVKNGWPQLKLDVVAVNAGDIRKTVAMVKELNKWKD